MKGAQKIRRVTNTTSRWTSQLYLNGHCIFCLRKVNGNVFQSTSSSDASQNLKDDGEHLFYEVPEAAHLSSNFINTFNEIWPYMQKNWKEQNKPEKSNDNNHGINLATFLRSPCQSSDSKTDPAFSSTHLPTICYYCADKVQAVEDIISSLRLKLRELRGIIHESKKRGRCYWRGKRFESNLKCAAKAGQVGEDVVTSTLDFFNSLGYSSEDEEDNVALSKGIPSNNDEDKRQEGSMLSMETNTSQVPEIVCKEESLDDDDGGGMEGNDDFSDMLSHCSAEGSEDVHLPQSVVKIEDDQDDTWVIPTPPKKSKVLTVTDTRSTQEEVEKFICTFEGCNVFYANKRAFQKHVSEMHPNQETGRLACTCGNFFLHEKSLRRHQRNFCKVAKEDPKVILQLTRRQTCDCCGIKVPVSMILEHIQEHVGDYAMKCPNDACGQVYSAYNSFISHVRGSTKCKACYLDNEKEFACDTCAFKADDHFGIRVHVDNFHERDPQNKLLKCPIASCDKTFSVRQSVHIHLNSHLFVDTTFQKCEHCNNKIKTEEISHHLKTEHDAGEILKCGQCPFSFSTRVALMEHLFVHRHSGMHCDICGDTVKYTRHNDLREHYRIAHDVTANKYICEHCSAEFWKKDILSQHVRLKHSKTDDVEEENIGKSKKTIDCQVCEEKFTGLAALIAHGIQVHGDQPFSCTQCEATFTKKKELSRHEKAHAGITLKKEFKCEISNCEKIYTTKRMMKNHVRLVHLGEKNFICDTCGKSYRSSQDLKGHQDYVHLGIRSHVCDTCGESFSSGNVLSRHKLIHTGERPFNCKTCGQRFRHKEVLKRHEEAHERKGADFKPNGPMKQTRKRKAMNHC